MAWALKAEFIVHTGTLQSTTNNPVQADCTVRWEGPVAAGETFTIGLSLPGPEGTWSSSAAAIGDGVTETLTRSNVLQVRPGLVYVPILTR